MSPPLPNPVSRSDRGPLLSAMIAAAIAAAILICLAAGVPVNLATVLWGYVPATMISAMMVSVSMGWMFVLAGRHKRKPWKLPVTLIFIVLAMAELLTIVIISLTTTSNFTGG